MVEKEDQHYFGVTDKFYESLQVVAGFWSTRLLNLILILRRKKQKRSLLRRL